MEFATVSVLIDPSIPRVKSTLRANSQLGEIAFYENWVSLKHNNCVVPIHILIKFCCTLLIGVFPETSDTF